MYFFCPGFDLLNNDPIFPFKKHILISVSSSSSWMPASNTNKWLRRHSIYIKAYFMPFGFKGKKSSWAESFSSNFSRKNVNMCTGSFIEVRKLCWPLWCEMWRGGYGIPVAPLTLWSLESVTHYDLCPLANHDPFSVSLDFYYLQQKAFPSAQTESRSHVNGVFFWPTRKPRKGSILNFKWQKSQSMKENILSLKFHSIDCIDSRDHSASTWPCVPMSKVFTFFDLKCLVASDG